MAHRWIACPCCGSRADVAFELPAYPLTEFYRPAEDDSQPTGFIDQTARYCSTCGHFFLEKVLDPSVIYSTDNYVTSSVSSKGAVECINGLCDFISNHCSKSEYSESRIIDIGGNDSTLLKKFKSAGRQLINIDPHASSDEEEIFLVNKFLEDVDFVEFQSETPTIYVSSHTFEHVSDPAAILRSLANVLTERDSLYLQFPSIEMLIKNLRFDQICHQHLHLFSLESITTLMESEGLYLHAYEYDNSHFGTVRLKFSRLSCSREKVGSPSLANIVDSFERYSNFYERLNASINDLFSGGQGFGAGLMVPTLAYHLPVIDRLCTIIDENPARIGKKFVNLAPSIQSTEALTLDEPILITSISTKAAARAIFNKLDGLGFKDICLPTITT